jgi:hypothetical protein
MANYLWLYMPLRHSQEVYQEGRQRGKALPEHIRSGAQAGGNIRRQALHNVQLQERRAD